MEISKSPLVYQVRGSGLLLGIALKLPVAKTLVTQLQERGLLVNATSDVLIRIAPPLIISDQQVSDFIETFREVAATHER